MCHDFNFKYSLLVYFVICYLMSGSKIYRYRSGRQRRAAKFRFMLDTSEHGEIFIVIYLLRHEVSVLLVSSEGMPQFSRLARQHRILMTY